MSGNWAPGRDYSAVPPPPRLSLDDYLQGILAHDRAVLARAITLIESSLPDQQEMARELVSRVLPHAGRSIRIGLTGVPGVGKSALIEAFGSLLTRTSELRFAGRCGFVRGCGDLRRICRHVMWLLTAPGRRDSS